MGSYLVEIKRCQHIKTSGAQCGSPALKEKEFCYYHQAKRTVEANIYLEGDRYADSSIMIPPMEDAHAVQTVVRHVLQLLLERRVERKDASLMLYALRIASGNLKQMQAEEPRPTQVVVEPEKAGETPMGMTPWSATGEGHDVEDEELVEAACAGDAEPAEEKPSVKNPAAPPTAEEAIDALTVKERRKVRDDWHESGKIPQKDWEDWIWHDGEDPLLIAVRGKFARRDRLRREEERREQAEICYQCKKECGDRVTLEEAGLVEAGAANGEADSSQSSGGQG